MAEPVSNIKDAGSPVSRDDRLNRVAEAPLPELLPGTPSPDHLLPEADFRSSRRLNAAAEKVGGAVGSAVGSMRRGMRVVGGRDRSRTRLDDLADPKGRTSDLADSAAATVSDLKNTASDKLDVLLERASGLSERAGERLGELKSTAGERVSDFADTARDRLHYARRRANHLTNEYPVQTILGFAGFAFVIGFALRIWRSNGN